MTEANEKTINEMLSEYNTIGNQLLTEFGDNFKPRASFKDRADATSSLSRIKQRLELKKSSFNAQESQEGGPVASETTPGLQRLRAHPQAEEIRQKTLAEQQTASENVAKEREEMTTATTTNGKSKKVKSVTPSRGRRSAFGEDQKIVVTAKENPRREGTGVHKQFELMKKHGTVGAYVKAGGSLGSLRKSVVKGWAKVQ